MDFTKPDTPNPTDFKTPRFDSDDPFDFAENRRSHALAARENLESKKKEFQWQQHATQIATEVSEAAKIYLQQLEAGWGAPLVQVGPATLYEFWLQVPGYSGTVRGFSASTSQTGQIQHVSHVTSKTTSGAGCAALGCLAAGPIGAVAGATMGKKNDVRTDVEVIDNRRFEIQVVGPGVAWSYVGNYLIEDSVRSFRDLLLARSTNMDDPRSLAIGQKEVVAVKSRSTELEYMRLKEADDRLRHASASFESAWGDYEEARLSVPNDLIARWNRSSGFIRILSMILGPVLTISWIGAIVIGAILNNVNTPNIIAVAIVVGIVQLVLLAILGFYYRIEIRLLKTLPSESTVLRPIYDFLNELLIGRSS